MTTLATAFLATFGVPLGDHGTYDAASAEIEPLFDDVTASQDRELQQRADDDLGERWGYEVGARRWLP